MRLVRKRVEIAEWRLGSIVRHYVGFGTEAFTDRGVKMILHFDSADLIQATASRPRYVLDRDMP